MTEDIPAQQSEPTVQPKPKREIFKFLRRLADCLFLIAAAAAVFMWFDTAEYRRVRDELQSSKSQEQIERDTLDTKSDVDRITKCGGQGTDARRACLLENKDTIKSYVGALVYVTSAGAHLAQSPDDEELRSAALRALEVGRAKLLEDRPALDGIERLARAHDSSILMRAKDGSAWQSDGLFGAMAKRFDKWEYALMLPAVEVRQRQWYLDNLPSKNTTDSEDEKHE